MHTVVRGLLPNGLRIVHAVRPHIHRAVLAVYVDVGSRHETPRTNGISHFLEHMLFRGTRRLPTASQLNEAIETLGATLTAATHGDYTRFEITVPPSALTEAAKLLGEILRAPTFSNIDVERGIVREEILEDLDDDHQDCNLDNLSRRQLFGRHPLGWRITGELENVDRFDVAALRSHMRKFYRAGNMVVSVSSPLHPIVVANAIARGFRGLPPGITRPLPRYEVTQHRARIDCRSTVGAQTSVRLAFPTPGAESPLGLASDMLMRVLDDGMSTRLHRRVCDELGLVYSIHANVELFRDVGALEIASNVAHANVPVLIAEVLGVLASLARDGVTASELERIKTRALFDLDAIDDDATALADYYGAAAVTNRSGDLAQRRRRVAGLTRDDLRRAAAAVFTPSRLNLVSLGDASSSTRRGIRQALRRFRDALPRATVRSFPLHLPSEQRIRPWTYAINRVPAAALDSRGTPP